MEKSQSISSIIIDSLSNKMAFNGIDYVNDTIQIEVLSNGKTAGIKLTKTKNMQLVEYITRLI